MGMGETISPDVRGWRMRGLRLGNAEKWREVKRRWKDNNPHLTLALLASQLSDEQLNEIHDRPLEVKPIRPKTK